MKIWLRSGYRSYEGGDDGLAMSRGDSHSLGESTVDLVREAIEDLVEE